MPTFNEQIELYSNSLVVWTKNYKGTGVQGAIFYKAKTEKDKGVFVALWNEEAASEYNENDTHIFIPAAGNYSGNELDHIGNDPTGMYWSSSLASGPQAFYLDVYSKGVVSDKNWRIGGFSVRAVRAKK